MPISKRAGVILTKSRLSVQISTNYTQSFCSDLTARLKFLRCMEVSRYFNNSKYISAGLESNKYKAWGVSQMYGRLSLPAGSSHPSDRGHLISAPCTFLTRANPSWSTALCTLVRWAFHENQDA